MFGLGRKKKQKNARTFKEGVAAFWEWYPTVAQRFFQTIEEGNCGDLADETTEFMAANLPALSWVFGPGEQGGHSFTVSGEGIVAKQLLAHHWVKPGCRGSRVDVLGIKAGEPNRGTRRICNSRWPTKIGRHDLFLDSHRR